MYQSNCLQLELFIDYELLNLLFWCVAELGSPEDFSAIEVFYIYIYNIFDLSDTYNPELKHLTIQCSEMFLCIYDDYNGREGSLCNFSLTTMEGRDHCVTWVHKTHITDINMKSYDFY